LYTSCVPRGALRFFNEISITYKKKVSKEHLTFPC